MSKPSRESTRSPPNSELVWQAWQLLANTGRTRIESETFIASEAKPECLELLNEFIKAFQSIPQRYCLFCEANAGLGIEAQKPDCPFRRATEIIKQKMPSAR